MAIIDTGLPAHSFLENLPDVILSGLETAANITITLDYDVIVNNAQMTPDESKMITIYAKHMIRNIITFAKPKETTKILPTLEIRAKVGELSLTTSSNIMPGGTDGDNAINADWFLKNFLTWQPQIIETTPSQPQWLACIVKTDTNKVRFRSKLYTTDGRTFDRTFSISINPFTAPVATYCQVDTNYDKLWSVTCKNENVEPICYDVFGFGYNLEDSNTTTQQLPQRYMLCPEHYNDVCFGFENTLGGFDTLMLKGKQTYIPEGDIVTFKTHTTEQELVNDYTSIWEANTGRFETDRAANQFQDFLKSTNRHMLQKGMWHRIIITEYKVKNLRGEPNAYSFKYHFADKNEHRYYERTELPEVELPTIM